MSEEELKAHKLKVLREQLKQQREGAASPATNKQPFRESKRETVTSPTKALASPTTPTSSSALKRESQVKKRTRPSFAVLDGNEEVPVLQSADEVLKL